MTKIQIIIDYGESLRGLTCNGIEIFTPAPSYATTRDFGFEREKEFNFIAKDVVLDETPQLISIPDELLIRIRDHNIDTEHQNTINETCELTKKIIDLKAQVAGWELRRDLAIEELERYEDKIDKIIDKYPRVAAEIALEDGNLWLVLQVGQEV